MQYYDLIGDIHGHGEELVKLLEHLGYDNTDTGYQHPTRKMIFLGDFIDRGEHLVQHELVLNTVMTMVENGHAQAVMGNHEFNALAYHTLHDGEYLRPHTTKNQSQHQAFLNEYEPDTERTQAVLEFFLNLPLWLELDGFRVVHACWDEKHISAIRSLTSSQRLDRNLLVEASRSGSDVFEAIETLLKGVEVELPDGASFNDKDGYTRYAVRVEWWNRDAKTLREIALLPPGDIADAGELPVPNSLPAYASTEKPCFIGHYWLTASTPEPLATNIACLDYSVAKGGKLVAYRWQGESELVAGNFVYI